MVPKLQSSTLDNFIFIEGFKSILFGSKNLSKATRTLGIMLNF
jgi:hypothetical protein